MPGSRGRPTAPRGFSSSTSKAFLNLPRHRRRIDRSKGGGYSASTNDWTWTQYGDTTIATNLYNQVQYSSAGAFADLAGSPPKAQLIASNMGFVMLANINDGAAKPDGWACCGLEDITDWTPTSTNQADSNRLYDTPGPIRALEPLRDSIIAYKDDSIYSAEYVGDLVNGIIWQWRLISDKVGASSAHGVCRVNDQHYFIHRSRFYVFRRCGGAEDRAGMHQFPVRPRTAGADPTTAQVAYDARENIVCFTWMVVYRGRDAQAFYNIETGKWSHGAGQTFTAGSAVGGDYYSAGIVKASQSDLIAFDATITTDTPSLVLIGKSDTLIAANAIAYNAAGTAPVTSQMRTGAIGDGIDSVTLDEVRPRMTNFTVGTTPTATFYADNNEMNVRISDRPPETLDTTYTAAWHAATPSIQWPRVGKFVSANMVFTNNAMEVGGLYLKLLQAGKR
ncbi:MAG: hypothetical protein IPG84_18220 [Betaproteobacteria bacterium]|nr:hypothetical protein [Betaproteobacteria bacterium]